MLLLPRGRGVGLMRSSHDGGLPSRLSVLAIKGVKRKDTRKLHGLGRQGGPPPLPEPKEYFRGVTLHQTQQIPGEESLTS